MSFDDPHPIEIVREYLLENGIGAGPVFGKNERAVSTPDYYFYAQAPKLEIYTVVVWWHNSEELSISVCDRKFDLHDPDSLQEIADTIRKDGGGFKKSADLFRRLLG